MLAPKPVSQPGMTPEQERALALARARRRRAEAEGQVQPAQPQPAPQAPGSGFDMAPSSPAARRDMLTPKPAPAPMAAAPGAQYSFQPTPEMQGSAPIRAAIAENDQQQREAGRIPLTTDRGGGYVADPGRQMADMAVAQREERDRQERREASRVNMGDMLITQDERGRLQPGTETDRDIGKGILTSPVRVANAAIGAAESAINLPSDIVNAVSDEYYKTGNTQTRDQVRAPRLEAPRIPLPAELESMSGQLTEGLAQFLLTRGAIGKLAPGGGLATQLGKDAVAVGVGFDGSTGRVADMIDINAIPEGPLRDYAAWLKTQPDDSPLVGRLKNLIEDMTFSGPMLAPQTVVRGAQAVGDIVNPRPVPTNAGGATVRPQPRPAPVGAQPAQQPQPAPAATQAPAAPIQPPPRPVPPGMAVPPQAAAQAPVPTTSSAQIELPTLTREEKRAADILIKRLNADGVTWDDVKRAAAAMGRRGDSGVYETIGELVAYVEGSSGANMRGLQMAGGVIPGKTQERIMARVAENDANLPRRVTRAATRATGQKAENAVDTLQALDQRLKTESGPRYEAFFSAPVNPQVFSNEVLPILNTEAGQVASQQALSALKGKEARLKARVASGKASAGQQREYAHVQQAARSLEDYLADPVRGTAVPTPYALDRIKRAFDNQIEAAGQGSEIARDLRGTKTDFADGVSNSTGGTYGEALGFYEGNKRLKDAFEFGAGALSKKSWQLKQDMESGLKGRAWSGGEIEAIAMGVARQIEDMVEANDQRALTMLIKGKALENLATTLGDPKAAARFEQSMRRLAANREWGRRVAKGSDTAMRQASVAEMATEADDAVLRNLDKMDKTQAPPTAFGLGWELLVSPVIKGAKDTYQRIRYAGLHDPKVNEVLAPILGDAATPETLKAADRIISARLAQKNQTSGPVPIGYGTPPKPKMAAPSAKAAPKPKPAPKSRKKPPPGTTSQSPAFVGGAVATGVPAGVATYVATGDEDLAMGVGLGAGIGGGFLGNRLAKAASGPKAPPKVGGGAKAVTPPPPPFRPVEGAPVIDTTDWTPADFSAARKQIREYMVERRTATAAQLEEIDQEITALRNAVNSDAKPEIGPNSKTFTSKDGTTYEVAFDPVPKGGVEVSFRPVDGPRAPKIGAINEFKPLNNSTLAQTSEVFREVEKLVAQDIATGGKPRYLFLGRTQKQRELYARMASTKRPPEGYEWEIVEGGSHVALVRTAQGAPPAAPPKVRAPVGGKVADTPAPAKPSATVSSVPQSRTVAKVTTADGRGYEVTADVIKDRDAVVMSPAWPSNIAEDLTNAIVHQRSRNRARASGMDLANDPPRSPDWAEQNPKEWASVQKQVGERFLGMARSTPGDAHILALVDGVDVNSLGSFLEANLPAGKRLLISPANGEIAIVSKGANLPQFETWTNLSPRYNQSIGLLPPPAEWATSAAAKTPSSGNVKPLAPKPPPVKNGIGSRSLPMDEASRMQRAREMGFDVDTPLYHGTATLKPFDEFGGPTWLSTDRAYAQDFAWEVPGDPWKARMYEVYARGRFKDVDQNTIERMGYSPEQIAALKREGFDGAKSPDGQVLVFDPANIRRTDATFDPSQEGSSKLLAGMKGAAPEMLAGAGSATLASMRDPDTNGDGVVSKQEALEHSGSIGGSFLATTMGVGLGRRMLGNKLKGGPKPPPPPPGAPGKSTPIKNAAGRAAVGAALAGMLVGDAEGQDDLTGKISETEQSIAAINKALADFDKLDARGKQKFLKDAGFYAGKIDGNIAGMTTEGIERWTAKQESAIGEAEAKLTDLVRRSAYQRNQPDPFMTALRDVGPSAAGLLALLGLKFMRGSAAKSSARQAAVKSNELNRFITKVPSKGLTSLITKSDTSRPANLNTLWQKGGASKDQLPFKQDSKGRWQPNPNAKPADELFADNGYWRAITKYVSGTDLGIILASGVDVGAAQIGIDHATKKLQEAEAEWKANPSDEAFQRVEDAQNELALYNLIQRVGAGVGIGRVIGAFGKPYAKPRPDIPMAATEQAAIKQLIASRKPPPKPRGSGNKLLPAPPPALPPPGRGGSN